MVIVTGEMSTKKGRTKSAATIDSDNEEFQLGDPAEGNPNWADSIANVLASNKPKTKKPLVLSKAKKFKKIQYETKSYNFEIDGEIEDEKPSLLDQESRSKLDKKKQISFRIKPSIADLERDRALKKIATKGVVQLFNAVRTQQKDLDRQLKEAGPLDHRKDAVLNNINKRKFLDILMGGVRAKSELVDNSVKKEEIKDEDDEEDNSRKPGQPGWSVLRSDFMTGKKFKHWDKEENDSDEQMPSGESDDDSSGAGSWLAVETTV